MIHQVAIKSLPQEWLWCETWCSDSELQYAKTIDLVRVVSLFLFPLLLNNNVSVRTTNGANLIEYVSIFSAIIL